MLPPTDRCLLSPAKKLPMYRYRSATTTSDWLVIAIMRRKLLRPQSNSDFVGPFSDSVRPSVFPKAIGPLASIIKISLGSQPAGRGPWPWPSLPNRGIACKPRPD